MGCTKCGTDTKLIELMFTKLVQDALKDGTLQGGLNDCNDKRLEKNTNVVTCSGLGDAVCALMTEGKLCINEPVALHFDADKGVLSLGMSDGKVLETTIELPDPPDNFLSDVQLDDKGVITFTMSEGGTHKVNISGAIKARAEMGADGTVTITNQDGTTVTFKDTDTTYTAGAGLSLSDTTFSAKTDGTTIRTNSDGQLEVIPPGCTEITDLNDLPFTTDGVHCIWGIFSAKNMPVNMYSNEATQPRGESELKNFDWTGWVVRSERETAVYIEDSGVTWGSTNDTTVAEGSKIPSTGWSVWRRETNVPNPVTQTLSAGKGISIASNGAINHIGSVEVTNAFGDRSLFYAHNAGERTDG